MILLLNMLLQLFFIIALIIGAFFFFWKIIFLRDPHREVPKGKVIVSPCDGTVLKVINYDAKKLRIDKGILGKIYTHTKEIGQKGTLVSIFMSPFVVHVTRNPLEGKVLNVVHRDGKLLPVTSLEAGLVNEHVELLMQNKKIGKFKMFLIAGFVARRIEPWVEKGYSLETGERNGRINLGSQVTVLFPSKVKISVKEGERVIAGKSVIGSY